MSTPARLQLNGISKHYPGVVANEAIDLCVAPGQIHAVLGENGAGKSTLMKIIYGAEQADAGEMRFNGQLVGAHDPQRARALGIAMVFQHFSLFETLSVAENVWLGLDQPFSLAEIRRQIQDKAHTYGLDIAPDQPVHALSVGQMQRVEIIRALLTNPQLLILDEPTSVLTPQAVDKLFVVLRRLAAQGCSILYISHKLHEIQALCSACTVLRGGRVAGVCDPREQTQASLSQLMIGAEPPQLAHRAQAAGELVLDVQGLSLPKDDPFGVSLVDLNLQLRAGEVLGIAGVSGNGQAELLRALSGETGALPQGQMRIRGRDVARLSPAGRRRLGLHFVPEERLGRGAVPSFSLAHNLLLTRTEALAGPAWLGGWLRLSALRAQAADLIARYGIKAAGPRASARSLSGGNLQKFIMAREMDAQPKLFIAAQPTWGVDVGAAAQIRAELLQLRDAGCAVLVVSEELDELFEVCDRLCVLSAGRLSPARPAAQTSVELLGRWMSGLWDDSEPSAQTSAAAQAAYPASPSPGGPRALAA